MSPTCPVGSESLVRNASGYVVWEVILIPRWQTSGQQVSHRNGTVHRGTGNRERQANALPPTHHTSLRKREMETTFPSVSSWRRGWVQACKAMVFNISHTSCSNVPPFPPSRIIHLFQIAEIVLTAAHRYGKARCMETGTVLGASCFDTAVMQDCLQHFTGQGSVSSVSSPLR